MDFSDGPELAAFRRRAREWLREALGERFGRAAAAGPRTADARMAAIRRWQRQLYDGGWAGLSWPKECGGQGASVLEQLVWSEEYARAWAPDTIALGVGRDLTGPVLIHKGKPWQRERFLPKILTGEEIWCQGFSEPDAGSDVAALRCRGEVQGDTIVVSGQKIWTSFAHFADWCILVVRTDPEAEKKHDGLSFLLVDMQTPGIEIRPLTEMTGENWFNEVFFDQVRVPRENVVGEIDRGWDVVIHTLSHERTSAAPHAKLEAELLLLRDLARRTPYRGRSGSGSGGGAGHAAAADDPVIRQKLAGYWTAVTALRINAYRNAAAVQATGHPGPSGSAQKLGWSELDQKVKALAAEILGPYGVLGADDPRAPDAGHWSHELLWSRAATIYAGTSEIQRNIIAERVLGLPR